MDAKKALHARMRGETIATPSIEEHFNQVRGLWFSAYSEIRLYLIRLDGDTSRKVGGLVQSIVDNETDMYDWPIKGAAKFVHDDPELWHEVADSRKK